MAKHTRHIAHLVASLRSMALVIAVLGGCGFYAGAQVIINGEKAFADGGSNLLLYSLPKSAFGEDFTAFVQVDTSSHWHNISIAG